MSLIELTIPHSSISIIGTSKNAGKTTTLNHIIKGLGQGDTVLGLTSIGRDGESTDIVTNTPKPEIFVKEGTIIATAEGLLPHCDITKQVLHIADMPTPLGRVVVVKALSSGYVQIGGPSMSSQIGKIVPVMEQLGAQKCFVDGAINRISPADPQVANATILCTGASVRLSLANVVAQTQFLAQMLSLPQIGELQESDIFLPGAVSDDSIKKIVFSGEQLKNRRIVVENAGKIFMKPQTFEKLLVKGASMAVKKAINLLCITINPFSPYDSGFDGDEFLQKMQSAVNVPVYNVKEI